jgi:hypothetical protein
MRSKRTIGLLTLTLASVLLLTACPSQTTIGKINRDPDRYVNKDVAIIGNVTDSYGVTFVGGAYKVDDGTGSIWVASRGGNVPSKGARVGVRGRVLNGFSFGGRNFGTVIEESEHRTRGR